ncbi:MAG TPA: putative quinol monooxygenase [Pyrinomonadaceae bacterium]|nr:putative quinol monooxygenase [Pyrinomonadaceae bacterium]
MTPIYTFATWQVREGELERVLNLLEDLTTQSSAEKGNISYAVYQSHSDANTLILVEGYTDDAALQTHRESQHFRSIVLEKVLPLLEDRKIVTTNIVTQKPDDLLTVGESLP